MATATRRTRKTAKTADKPVTVKKAPTVRKRVQREQDSVTITMQRGKRNRDSRVIEPHEPKAGGGVRFEEIADNGASPVYLSQEQDASIGSPQKIRVTIKAL